MDIKGLDQIRKHVPGLNNPLGILGFFLPAIILSILVTAFFTGVRFPWYFWPLAAEIVTDSLGFLLMDLFIQHKQDYKARFGLLACCRAASRFGFPGVVIIAAVIAHIRDLPGPEIPRFGWYIIIPMLGWVLIALGALLALRTILTFGVDNLTMLYVYFPEESSLVNHKIYSILRHPAYTAIQCIAFGLALLNGGWFALASAVIFSLGLWGWVRLVEEKELIQRFGPAYVEYRKRVPAFWPRMRDLGVFFGFLVVAK